MCTKEMLRLSSYFFKDNFNHFSKIHTHKALRVLCRPRQITNNEEQKREKITMKI